MLPVDWVGTGRGTYFYLWSFPIKIWLHFSSNYLLEGNFDVFHFLLSLEADYGFITVNILVFNVFLQIDLKDSQFISNLSDFQAYLFLFLPYFSFLLKNFLSFSLVTCSIVGFIVRGQIRIQMCYFLQFMHQLFLLFLQLMQLIKLTDKVDVGYPWPIGE